jgi:hypothetical protein
MKRFSLGFLVLIIVIFAWVSCTKNGGPNALPGQIALSKSKIKINEPDSMALVGADTTKSVTWSITPLGQDTLLTLKNAARVKFIKAGTYTIKASSNGNQSDPVTITVSDSIFAPTPYLTPLNTNEQYTIVPEYLKKPGTDFGYLAFKVTTKGTYCGNSQLEYAAVEDSVAQAYYLAFDGVIHPYQCGLNNIPLTSLIDFNYWRNPFPIGTFPFHVVLGPTIYDGSVTITSSTITFTWPYTSPAVITPLQINK